MGLRTHFEAVRLNCDQKHPNYNAVPLRLNIIETVVIQLRAVMIVCQTGFGGSIFQRSEWTPIMTFFLFVGEAASFIEPCIQCALAV
jgi:hypothetical protein